MSNENVREFVRNTLGCSCAEDVFRHIENERGMEAGGVVLRNKINVGNRLLVYVVEAGTGTLAEMPALVAAGKEERDSRGFNRFRLVLASDDNKLKRRSLEAFNALGATDDKIHLHIIGKAEAESL